MRYPILLTSLFLLFLGLACEAPAPAAEDSRHWLFVRSGPGLGVLDHGDVLTLRGEDLVVRNVLTGKDTVVRLASAGHSVRLGAGNQLTLDGGVASGTRLLPLDPPATGLDTSFLTRQPFTYRFMEQDYWASFEPAFTGFPEFTRPGARDFVNRMVDWAATAPGLEYSEYRLIEGYGQPILLLSERQRGRYVNTLGVLVDTVASDAFGGRVFHSADNDYPAELLFRSLPQPPSAYDAESFVDLVNQGYSRSYLLVDPARERPVGEDKRLPRKSLIDPGDLGRISASFLEDGSVMFLSDDHIVLQGSYVLDLDKGMLTVTDPDGASFRVFVETNPGIRFTLPVSVVELEGGQLVGQDNYLRIEVVE